MVFSQRNGKILLDFTRIKQLDNLPYTAEEDGMIIANINVWRCYHTGVYVNGIMFTSAWQSSDTEDAWSNSGSCFVSKGDVISSTVPSNKRSIVLIPYK